MLLACALLAAQWMRQGALLPAATVMLGALAVAQGMRVLLRAGGIRRIRLQDQGQVRLFMAEGEQEAWLAPCSLGLGNLLLLVLRRPGRPALRVLLGPGQLSAGDGALLRRWFRNSTGGGGTRTGVLG